MLVVISLINEVVVGVGAAHDGAGEGVGISGLSGEPSGVASPAADERRIQLVGNNGGSSVVQLLRVVRPISHHVTRCSGVVSKNVVHLINQFVLRKTTVSLANQELLFVIAV